MAFRIGNSLVNQSTGYPVIRLNLLNMRTGKPSNRQTQQRGFTLVELMISVVILGFGLCIVIRSYMSALAGLDMSRNAVESARFAQQKLDELTSLSFENNGLTPDSESGSAILGSREFNWKTEISEIENPEYLTEDFVEALVNVDWQERNISKNTTLLTYLPKKKKEEQ